MLFYLGGIWMLLFAGIGNLRAATDSRTDGPDGGLFQGAEMVGQEDAVDLLGQL